MTPNHAAGDIRTTRDGPMTRNGVKINFSGALAIQAFEDVPDMTFESGWSSDDAVYVRHPRVRENIAPEEPEARHLRLRDRTGATCIEAFARTHGAAIFNHSRH